MVKFHISYLFLVQMVAALLFYFLSHNSYKTVILYFSVVIFVAYWIIRLFFNNKKI
jgi:hypothetical protein